MTAIVLIAGAATSSILLAAIVLDRIVSARTSEPAPKEFSLFLWLFLFFQMAAFILSAVWADPSLAPETWKGSRLSQSFLFVLEDLRRGFSAVLVWYLPRFLFVSLGLVYSEATKRLFLALLILIGLMRILVINAQAAEFWANESGGWVRSVFALEDSLTLPLFYGLSVSLIVITARRLTRPGGALRKPYFLGIGFLASLVVFLLADFAERLCTDPFLAPPILGLKALRISPFPFLSVSGLFVGLAVIARSTSSLRRAFAQVQASAPPFLDALLRERGLTPRETEIARLIVKGYVNKEIAAQLDIGYGTVKNHAYSLYGKLGITSRFELIKLLEPGNQSPAPCR
ncbi:MAG: LuxR C-terminal-related transcriptional regulator [Acidobacteriota bacterium]